MARLRIFSLFSGSSGEQTKPDQTRRRLSRKSVFGIVSERVSRSSMGEAGGMTEQPTVVKSPVVLLAEKILSEAEKLETYTKLHGVSPPGHGSDAPVEVYSQTNEIRDCLEGLAVAADELSYLAKGPQEHVRWTAWRWSDCMTLQILSNYGIAKLVPLDAPISLHELSSKTTLDPVVLARLLRHSLTNHIFEEPSPGLIAHSASSRILAQSQPLQDWVGFNCEETFPASAHMLQALEASPEATSVTQTGFNHAIGTAGKEPMFVTLGRDPSRARRLGGAMMNFTCGDGYQVSHLVDSWDLSLVNEARGTFVDLGGSHGFVSIDLAKRWEKIKFVVQDLPMTIQTAPNPICEDETVAARIEFQAHDFFTEQPVKNADIYFFRWIMHNHSAPYAISILRSLIPALKPGARIVINEHCLSAPGQKHSNPVDERLMRGMDMVMMTLLNAEERDELGFRSLFAAADDRFEFKGVQRIPGCRMSIIEAVWSPDKAGSV